MTEELLYLGRDSDSKMSLDLRKTLQKGQVRVTATDALKFMTQVALAESLFLFMERRDVLPELPACLYGC
jgi:hypothetical protein